MATGSNQKLATLSACSTCMCGGSLPSILKKKNLYPLILNTVGTRYSTTICP
jgi:hypothetical protein